MENFALIAAIVFGKLTIALLVSFCFPRSDRRVTGELSLIAACALLAVGLFVGLGYQPLSVLPSISTVHMLSLQGLSLAG
jgi:hypothetical protein